MDLKDGPLVVEIPPGVLGLADDAWMRYIIDLGLAGPDKGKGGKFLFPPPDYTGAVPEGYFVVKSRTYNVWVIGRAVNGPKAAGLVGRARHARPTRAITLSSPARARDVRPRRHAGRRTCRTCRARACL